MSPSLWFNISLESMIALLGNLLLFCLVFGMSATVDFKCFQSQLRNHKAIMAGLFCQFMIMPMLGFVVVKFFDLDSDMGIILLVVTSSPGGSYSNWWCSLFNADLALSVTMTAISTILSVLFLPANLYIYIKFCYDKDILSNLDWSNMFIALLIVIMAISFGLYCSYTNSSYTFNLLANRIGNISGLLLVIFSGIMTCTGDTDSKIWSRGAPFYITVSLPCILGLFLANGLTILYNLPRPERVTVAIECCYQNVGIATSIALTMYRNDRQTMNDVVGVPFFYGIVEMWLIGGYCILCWKAGWTKAPANESFWNVILTSYEVIKAKEIDDHEQILLSEQNNIEISISQSNDTPDHLITCDYKPFGIFNTNYCLNTYYGNKNTNIFGPGSRTSSISTSDTHFKRHANANGNDINNTKSHDDENDLEINPNTILNAVVSAAGAEADQQQQHQQLNNGSSTDDPNNQQQQQQQVQVQSQSSISTLSATSHNITKSSSSSIQQPQHSLTVASSSGVGGGVGERKSPS